MSRRLLFRLLLLAAFVCSLPVMAEEPAPTAEVKAPAATVTTAEIADIVKQLDADDFKTRQLAAEKLTTLGKAAIPALSDAAQSTQLELMSQSLGILRGFYQDNNAELKAAAKEALEKVAAGTNPNAAQRAKDLLAPQKENGSNDPNQGNIIAGNGRGQIIINGGGGIGRIQIGGMPLPIGGGARVYSKSVSNANGVKTTKVKQDGVEIEITEGKEEITVKKTENGKTEEFKAKDADDLKKKHPAGHELFEKHAGDKNAAGGAINLQIGGNIQAVPLPAQIMPAIPLQPAIPMNAKNNRAETQLKAVERMLESAEQILNRTADTAEVKDATKPVSEHLAKARAELAKAQEKLGGQEAKENDAAESEKIRKNIEAMKQSLKEKNQSAKQVPGSEEKPNPRVEIENKRILEEAQAKMALEQAKQEAQRKLDEVKRAIEQGNK
jgi:hypothetical protein